MLRSALVLGALAFAAAPAAAASYSAKLIQPTTNRFIARDIVWNCGAAACQGATDDGRPVVLCQSLAKKRGPGRFASWSTAAPSPPTSSSAATHPPRRKPPEALAAAQ